MSCAELSKTIENYSCWCSFIYKNKGFMEQSSLHPVSVSLIMSQN